MSASRTRARKASGSSPGCFSSAEKSIASRTSLSGMAVSLTVAAMRSTISPAAGQGGGEQQSGAEREAAHAPMITTGPVLFFRSVSQTEKSGRLLVVGTPIGNLEDLSPRARRALSEADAIFCEDTRVTAKLAARFGLPAPRVSCPGAARGVAR